eukprot:CAMPEP_0181251678 /NCGR_PEP_ID=MMETSP1096-20121128/47022_1 /TAXON_ID=156174 ORGANISM="Chrysochromulina ericina, Strain CCMP281" /NCGR_SAMPLE_ID=MMETSP1096 /ASSEMBLY_ACC=CAM_ASM_000453 /LENGTH=55 /DNA_ID=CAMNT_0023349311 /DNA_START=68 /DNA_END=232 /DNA_ORIENTATION=+
MMYKLLTQRACINSPRGCHLSLRSVPTRREAPNATCRPPHTAEKRPQAAAAASRR